MAYYNSRTDTQSTDPSVINPDNHRGQDPTTGVNWNDPRIQSINDRNRLVPAYQSTQPVGNMSLIDQSLYGVPGSDALKQAMLQQYGNIQGQTAYTAQGAQMSPMANSAGTNIGPAAQSQAVQMGPALQSAGVNIGPAAQSAESAFRQNQADLVGQLNKYATGQESVSQLQLRQNTDANIAQQMAMANSARPGQGAMAQRLAAQNAGMANTQLAGQAAVAGLQERQAAASQLNSLLGTARGQDLSNSQFNAGQSNQMAQAQGQITSAGNIANMQSGNTYNLGVGNMQAGNNQYNAGQMNNQAQVQGSLNNQNNMFNAGQANNYSYNAANMAQNNQQFNATAQNTQQTAQNQALNNAMLVQLQLADQQQRGGIANANNQNASNMNLANNRTQWDIANLNHVGPGGQILNMGATALPWLATQLKNNANNANNGSGSGLSDLDLSGGAGNGSIFDGGSYF